jgi:hypothetical protein
MPTIIHNYQVCTRTRPVGQLRNEQLKNVEEIAFVPDKLPISTSGPVEKQLFPSQHAAQTPSAPTPGLVQHRIVWRLPPSEDVLFS